MKKNILITGSSGFIGRNLIEKLNDKYPLLTPTHSELELTDYISVRNYFEKHQIGTVIHCASRLEKGRRKGEENCNTIKDNLQMFFNILDSSANYDKLINCGSGGEYSKDFEVRNVSEDNFGKNIPTEDYAFSKYVMSKYIKCSPEKIINMRLFAVFGKYEEYRSRFISNAICKNILKLPITIRQNAFFDYLYIDDLARIIKYFIQNNPHENIYNICTGKPIDLLTIAEKINQIGDFKSEIIVEKSGLNKEYTGNNGRFMKEIKEFEFTPLEEALKSMYSYYQKNIDKLNLD